VSDSGTDDPRRVVPNEQSETPPGQFTLPGIPVSFASAMQVQISAHQGPLPPPQVLAAYEQAHPGAAAWVLREAEASAAHVREMERRVLRYQARDALLHRILPFALVALLLTISAILAIFASPVLGGAAFFGTLAGVVGIYLKGAMDSGKQPAGGSGSDVVSSPVHPPTR
jgi:uncharacterized membrane protein